MTHKEVVQLEKSTSSAPEQGLMLTSLDPYTRFHPKLHMQEVVDDRYVVAEQTAMHVTKHSSVYRAVTHIDGQTVQAALKLFVEPTEQSRRLVDEEIRTHLQLTGIPNILPALSAGKVRRNGLVYRYLALEYCPDGTLDDMIQANNGAAPADDMPKIAQYGYDMAGALMNVHTLGRVHGDVAAKNVFRTHDNRALVGDLGLVGVCRSRVQSGIFPFPGDKLSEDDTELLGGSLFGTLGHIAPEGLVDNPVPTPQIDSYGLGATLYAVETGMLPHEPPKIEPGDSRLAEKLREFREKLQNEPMPHPCDKNISVPIKLGDLTMELLRSDPTDRLTVSEARQELGGMVLRAA